VIIFRWILLGIRHVSENNCGKNQNTHFIFKKGPPSARKSSSVWDNMQKYGTAAEATYDNILRRMHIACWVSKVTDTNSDCIIIIYFPWQQWLRECASMLRYTWIACLLNLPSLNHKKRWKNVRVCLTRDNRHSVMQICVSFLHAAKIHPTSLISNFPLWTL
jgi:hypothetical protein